METETLEQVKDDILLNIKQKIRRTDYAKFSTCDAPNWDANEHYVMLKLYRNQPKGLIISYTINFGVHDWYVVET